MHAENISADDALLRATRIRLMIFDVDGVLTDGSLHFTAEGEQIKTFNVLDGHGIKLLQRQGIATAIVSARRSAAVARRAEDLGIAQVVQGAEDKFSAFEQLLAANTLDAASCGFIGDDVIDLPILMRAGFAASVPHGHPEVRKRVHYVTQAGGGRGAVREICDFILRAQGKYEAALAPYLR